LLACALVIVVVALLHALLVNVVKNKWVNVILDVN
jgi:hypothetical protein